MIKRRRFFKKKKKSKKYREYNKFFSYKFKDRRSRLFLYKDFSNSDSFGTTFNFSKFLFAKFYKVKMKNCGLNGCLFEWVEFSSSNFNHSRFRGAIFKNVSFENCVLKKAIFKDAKFENVYMSLNNYKQFKGKTGIYSREELKDIDIKFLKESLDKLEIKLNNQSLQRLLLAFDEALIINALKYKKPLKNNISYVAKIILEYKNLSKLN